MLRKTIITSCAALSFLTIHAQHWDWFRTGQGIMNWPLQTSNIVSEGNNRIAALFSFYDTVNIANQVFTATGGQSGCIIRYDTAGQFINAFTIPVFGGHLGIANDGDYLVCGLFADTILWENQLLIPDGTSSAYVAKTDTSGNLRWIKKIEAGNNYLNSITGSPDGKIYAVGSFDQSFLFAGDSVIHPGTSDWDGMFLVFDENGQELACKTATGRSAEYFTQIITDDAGTIAVSGIYGYSCQLVTDTFTSYFDSLHISHYEGNFMPGFVAVYNNDLSIRWVKQSASSDIAFDSQGNLLAAGTILGSTFTLDDTLTFNNPQYNTTQCLIIKYKPSGERIWQHFFGTACAERLDNVEIVSGDRIVIMGTFSDSLAFSGEPVLYGSFETYWGCFDPGGNCLWMSIQASANFSNPGWLVKGNAEDCFIAGSCMLSFSLQGNMPVNVPPNTNVLLIARLKLNGSYNSIPDPDPIPSENMPVLYPNPGSGEFYIQSNAWTEKAITLTGYDAAGRKCIYRELEASALHTLSLQEFPAGIYEIRISDRNGETIHFRLVKTN